MGSKGKGWYELRGTEKGCGGATRSEENRERQGLDAVLEGIALQVCFQHCSHRKRMKNFGATEPFSFLFLGTKMPMVPIFSP